MALTLLQANDTLTISNLRPGGQYLFHTAGDTNGSNVTLSWSDGTNTVAFSDGTFEDDNGEIVFYSPTSTVVVAGGASLGDVYFGIVPITNRS